MSTNLASLIVPAPTPHPGGTAQLPQPQGAGFAQWLELFAETSGTSPSEPDPISKPRTSFRGVSPTFLPPSVEVPLDLEPMAPATDPDLAAVLATPKPAISLPGQLPTGMALMDAAQPTPTGVPEIPPMPIESPGPAPTIEVSPAVVLPVGPSPPIENSPVPAQPAAPTPPIENSPVLAQPAAPTPPIVISPVLAQPAAPTPPIEVSPVPAPPAWAGLETPAGMDFIRPSTESSSGLLAPHTDLPTTQLESPAGGPVARVLGEDAPQRNQRQDGPPAEPRPEVDANVRPEPRAGVSPEPRAAWPKPDPSQETSRQQPIESEPSTPEKHGPPRISAPRVEAGSEIFGAPSGNPRLVSVMPVPNVGPTKVAQVTFVEAEPAAAEAQAPSAGFKDSAPFEQGGSAAQPQREPRIVDELVGRPPVRSAPQVESENLSPARVEVTAQALGGLSETKSHALLRNEALAQAILTQARSLPRAGSVKIRMSLSPPDLGTVQIKVEASGVQLRVELLAATSGAAEALNAALPRLTAQLNSAGYAEADVTVGLETPTGAGTQAGGQRGTNARESSGHPSWPEPNDAPHAHVEQGDRHADPHSRLDRMA